AAGPTLRFPELDCQHQPPQDWRPILTTELVDLLHHNSCLREGYSNLHPPGTNSLMLRELHRRLCWRRRWQDPRHQLFAQTGQYTEALPPDSYERYAAPQL